MRVCSRWLLQPLSSLGEKYFIFTSLHHCFPDFPAASRSKIRVFRRAGKRCTVGEKKMAISFVRRVNQDLIGCLKRREKGFQCT